MATSTPTEILLGCDPIVRVQVIEDDGNLVLILNSTDGLADIDGIFFNLNNDAMAPDLTIFPEVDTQDVVDFTVAPGTLNQLNNGAQIQEQYDVRVEFGVEPFSSGGTVTDGGFTLYLDAGFPLTAADIDVDNMTVVVNSDGGEGGLALTNVAQPEPQTVIAISEDFSGLDDPAQAASIISDGKWDVRHGDLFTNGSNDGTLTFQTVQSEGPVEISFDARGININRFEDSGRYADNLEVQVNIDGEWITLDTFVVNDAGNALVGDQTGQEILSHDTQITYSGGDLADVQGDVQLRIVSDISANDEKIRIDNVEVSVTEVAAPHGETCIDFDDAEAGDVVFDQFEGVTITAQRAGDRADSENDAMIFDSNSPTGGDHDLGYDGQNNIIIISEDNDSDDPDDEAHGGTISFDFEEISTVGSITVLDTEENGGTIDLYDAQENLLASFDIPNVGDNGLGTVNMNVEGVAVMDVNFTGSGAVDDLCFTGADELPCGQYDTTYDDFAKPPEDEEEDDDPMIF